jgi:hypothetical protein
VSLEGFADCSSLTKINLNATSVGENCFTQCKSLTDVDLPKVTNVGRYCFSYYRNLININLPLLKTVAKSPFLNCVSIRAIHMNEIITLKCCKRCKVCVVCKE